MKKILVSIFIYFSLLLPSAAKVDIKFTPSSDCENTIVDFINNSQNNLEIAVYSINNVNIVNALKNAHDRGVQLKILTDRLQASSKYSKVIDLYKYGINIKINSKYKIEHNKFAIYDGVIASTGSFNWTNPASSKNSENCVFFTHDIATIEKYKSRFNQLWNANSQEKSDRWFKRMIIKRNYDYY